MTRHKDKAAGKGERTLAAGVISRAAISAALTVSGIQPDMPGSRG
jgi:hypothetical protein